jgi:hypothetical protein
VKQRECLAEIAVPPHRAFAARIGALLIVDWHRSRCGYLIHTTVQYLLFATLYGL